MQGEVSGMKDDIKSVADQIYAGNLERIAIEIETKRQHVIADAVRRNILRSGIYLGNRMRVEEEYLQNLCQIRAQSYLTVMQEAGLRLGDAEVSEIMAKVSDVADRNTESLGQQMDQLIKTEHLSIRSGWAKANLDRVKASVLATIRRNLVIERGLQALRTARPTSDKTTKNVFVVMSFHKELDETYEKGILPAIQQCGLNPCRVDREEFEGTITQAILDKIASSQLVVADLTYERPNCYYELGYAIGVRKPCIITARQDHDPRRPGRGHDEPKVHFDLDSHKITYWDPDRLDEFKENVCGRIREVSKSS